MKNKYIKKISIILVGAIGVLLALLLMLYLYLAFGNLAEGKDPTTINLSNNYRIEVYNEQRSQLEIERDGIDTIILDKEIDSYAYNKEYIAVKAIHPSRYYCVDIRAGRVIKEVNSITKIEQFIKNRYSIDEIKWRTIQLYK